MNRGGELHQDAEGKPISYPKEILTHQGSLYAFLSASALSTLMAIPYGLAVAAIPMILFAAGEALAVLFLSGSPRFRAKVQKRHRVARREKARSHLLSEIKSRVSDSDLHWDTYRRMLSRIESLTEIAASRRGSLEHEDVERFSDATVNFLGLWLAKLVISERQAAIDQGALEKKLRLTRERLEKLDQSDPAERRRLKNAEGDLLRVMSSRERLQSRLLSVDAALLAMSEALEEIYQSVMLNPSSGQVTKLLESAVERIRTKEEIDAEFESELNVDLDELLGDAQPGVARAANRKAQRSGH